MNLPDLLHSLTISGLKMSLGPDNAIDITGPTKHLTDDHRQSVRDNRSQIVALLGCFTESETGVEAELCEREAIQYSNSDHAQLQAIKIGNDFTAMVQGERWAWNKIGSMETVEDLDAFAKRFENDIKEFEYFRPIADDIRELIANRRVLLYPSNKANDRDASTSRPF